jgi:hypothetical protein
MSLNNLYIMVSLLVGIHGEIWAQNNSLNFVINNVFKDSIVKADLVLNFINVIHDKNELNFDTNNFSIPPPPSVPGVLYYDREDFIEFNRNNLISIQDIDFMYNQVKVYHKCKLSSKKIGKELLNPNVFIEYRKRQDYTYDFFAYLKDRYKAESYVIFTNALFSQDMSKCLIGFRRTDRSGTIGRTYLLYFYDDSWKIYKEIFNQNN